MTVALCLITWNEIDGCKLDVPQIDKTKFEQVYCIDGGSTDGTVEFLLDNEIEVYKQERKGLNQACKEAVQKCKCDAVIFFHPKGTVPVKDIYKFRYYFEKGYDFVVASRMLKESYNEEDDQFLKPRKWFGLLLAFLAFILYKREGHVIRDSLHGFRGIKVDAFNKMDISDLSPSIDIEMVCRAYKCGISRIEFPTKEKKRNFGETHFKALPTGYKLLKYMLWEMTRK